jgi:hypothetical protein
MILLDQEGSQLSRLELTIATTLQLAQEEAKPLFLFHQNRVFHKARDRDLS